MPFNLSATELEADTLGLHDLKRLEIFSHGTVFLGNEAGEILVDFALGNGATNFRDIDRDDFAVLGVDNGTKIEGKRVLIVRKRWSVVHQCLLKADFLSPVISPSRVSVYHRSSYPMVQGSQ